MVRTDSEISLLNGDQSRLTQNGLLPTQFTEFVRQACDDFIGLRSGQGFLRENHLIGGSAKIGTFPIITMLYYKHPQGDHCASTQANIKLSGYRTAQHLLQLAHKFHRPLVVFTTSQSSVHNLSVAEPHHLQGVSNLLLSQCRLEAPIILLVLSRWASGDIFGTWLADKMLALEDTRFLMTSCDQVTAVPVQVGAQYLVHQRLLDYTVPTCLNGTYATQVPMPQPTQLRAALEEMLKNVAHASSKELMARRSKRLEQLETMATRALRRGKQVMVPSLNGSIAQ